MTIKKDTKSRMLFCLSLILVSLVMTTTAVTNINTFISNKAYADPLDGPEGVAVDSQGNVFVVDNNNERIQKFTSSGSFITKWGSQGFGNGQFESAEGVAVDSQGNVFVADTDNERIQKTQTLGVL
jgi:tripartite motif-containing protein 71